MMKRLKICCFFKFINNLFFRRCSHKTHNNI